MALYQVSAIFMATRVMGRSPRSSQCSLACLSEKWRQPQITRRLPSFSTYQSIQPHSATFPNCITGPWKTKSSYLAPFRSAPDRLALDRLAPDRLAPDRSAPDRLALYRLALD